MYHKDVFYAYLRGISVANNNGNENIVSYVLCELSCDLFRPF